jgi:predicted HD superfamily hydrolase involved in NAD metabolism
MNENLKNKIKQFVKTKMSNERYNHCLCVSLEAKSLAKHYGEDTEKAEIAGLLHDVTKEFSKEEHLELINKNKIDLSKIERNTPKLWHAITAPFYIREKLGINDEDILSAVRYHTTGKECMTKLEKIIFLADFVSEDRFKEFSNAKTAKEIAYKNLDKGVLYELKESINKLVEKNSLLCLDTVKAYNYYVTNS